LIKILIISNRLTIGGAEKLLYELVQFAKGNQIEPQILILDNYNNEYYDDIFKGMGVPVIRTRISAITHFRAPGKMLRSIIWSLKLKYFADRSYDAIHVMGMYNVDRILHSVVHKKRFFWHVNNTTQFFDENYPYQAEIFGNANDTVVCINSYQIDEINRQYGDMVKSKLSLFKLFITKV
jgi:hypothetical protein